MGYKILLLISLVITSLLAEERFYNVDENLLIDSELKIEWMMNFKETNSLSEAKSYCQGIHSNNRVFRLPTMQELMSLVKYSVINSKDFLFSGEFWSSSLDETDAKNIKIFSVTLPSGSFKTKEFNSTLNTLCIHDINDSI